MTIINSKADLRQYIDDVLTDWTFDATIEEMTEELTSMIWSMSTPLLGEDWSCVFDRLNWDQLIIEADAEIKVCNLLIELHDAEPRGGRNDSGMADN